MDLITRLDLYSIGRDYLRQRAQRINPTEVDIEGSNANLFVGSTSMMGDALIKQLLYQTGRLLLDNAFGEDLDRYAYDRYGLLRKGAAPARGSVRIYRTSGGPTGTIPLGTKLKTINDIEYITTSLATFGGSDLVAPKVYVRAVQAGKASQVGANYIQKFAEPALLFDPSLQVLNDAAMAGGEEIEEDDDFKNRIRDFWRTARRGTLAAIEFGARSVPGVTSAQAIEALTGNENFPARVVSLFIADSSGVASDALGRDVVVQLGEYRAAGIAVIVYTSMPLAVSIVLSLTFRANVDTQILSDNIRAAIVEYVNSLPVNGTLSVADLYAVLLRFRADGLIPSKESIVAPTGDLVPNPGQSVRITLDNVLVA